MARISIASERLLEICSRALAEVNRQQTARSAGGFSMSTSYEVPAFDLLTAHGVVRGLQQTAERAIRIGGQGNTQVTMEGHEIDVLEWLKAT